VTSQQISHNGAPSCSLLPVLQEQGEHFRLRASWVAFAQFWIKENGQREEKSQMDVRESWKEQ